MKTCTKCHRELPATTEYFHRHPPAADGLKPRCKQCRRPESRAEYLVNADKVKARAAAWTRENPERRRAITARANAKIYERPRRWLTARISVAVGRSLKYRTNGRRAALLAYSIDELMAHIERLWKPGMSWANYGAWHVDHVRPVSSFAFTAPTDPAFQECWSLTNLQPLWAGENLSKGARWAS